MATKPSDTYEWSTDPLTTVDPGASRKATGFRYSRLAPPKWFNWLFNGNGLWNKYHNDLHVAGTYLNWDTSSLRTVSMPLTIFQADPIGDWKRLVDFTGSGSTLAVAGWSWGCAAPSAQPLVGLFQLPIDVSLTRVRVEVDPAAGGGGSPNNMRVKVWRVTYDIAGAGAQTWTQIGTQEASNGLTRRTVSVTVSPTAHTSWAEHYAITVTPSDGAGPGLDYDLVLGVDIDIDEPGPRNAIG